MPADRSSKKRTWLLSLVVSLIGLVLALVMGEIFLRLMGFESKLVYRPNPYYGWSHNAHDRFSRMTDGREIEISINSKGLRDREYSYERAPDAYRILVLGDSFTEAFQVELDESFPKVLETELTSRFPGGSSAYEVLGAGVSGFGTDNELLFYRHEGYKYKPDLVMLALYIGNDVRNNWYELDIKDSGELRKPYFVIDDGKLAIRAYPFERHTSVKTRLKVFLNRNVVIYSMFREVRDQLRHKRKSGRRDRIPLDVHLFADEYSPEWDAAWAVTKSLILALRDEVGDNGAELFVVMIPTRFQVHEEVWRENVSNSEAMQGGSWDLNKPNAILADFLHDAGVPHLDLLPVLREQSERTGKEYYLADDGHWNQAGHMLSAQFVAHELGAGGLVAVPHQND